MTQNDRLGNVEIAADGDGLVSRSGTALIAELSDRLGLTAALSGALADTRERAGGHDRGRVLRDLALSLAEARFLAADWQAGYNHEHPHSALGMMSPTRFAASWQRIEEANGSINPELSQGVDLPPE